MMEIPLFPLSHPVLPDGRSQLRIFERRYLDMIKDCFRNDSGFGICLIREGSEVGEAATPHPLGTIVEIIDWDSSDNGMLQIVVEGKQNFRLLHYFADSGNLLFGDIQLLPNECPIALDKSFLPVASKLDEILNSLSDYIHYPHRDLDNAVWVANRLIELLPMSAQDKITLLLMQSCNDRLRILHQVLFNRSV